MVSEDTRYIISFVFKSKEFEVYKELSFTKQRDLGRFLSKIEKRESQYKNIIPESIKVYFTTFSQMNNGCVENIKKSYESFKIVNGD